MKKTYIKPAKAGIIVPHPETGKPLSESGEAVEMSSYWRRRIKDGDVVTASAAKADKSSSKKS